MGATLTTAAGTAGGAAPAPTGSVTATYARTIGGPSLGAFYSSGFDFDEARDRIVLADTGLSRVVFYGASGSYEGEFGAIGTGAGEFHTPRDVAVDAASNIYVADTDNGRVQSFDAEGRHRWTTPGMSHPMGIGYDAVNDQVLVASPSGSRIRSLDPLTGAVKWVSPSPSVTGLSKPRDAARGPDGRVWVADYGNHQVKAFDVTPAGSWTASPSVVLGAGTRGPGAGHISFPYNVDFSPDGQIAYVSDTGNGRIARWDLSGPEPAWLEPFGGQCPTFPKLCDDPPEDAGLFDDLRRVVVKPDGNVLGDDFWGAGVHEFAPDGTVVRMIERVHPPAPGFAQAFGVAVAADGTTYVVDRLNHRVQRFAPDGSFEKSVGSRGRTAKYFSWPESAAVAPDGSVWVLDSQHDALKRWSADLSTVEAVPSVESSGPGLGQFATPEGLAVDATGAVWIADTLNHRVQRYDPDTRRFSVVGTKGTGNGQLLTPRGIAAAGDHVYVADSGNNRIAKFTVDGTWIANSSVPLTSPEGVAVAPDGSVWVADTLAHRIVHLDAALKDVGDTFGGFGDGDYEFYRPHELEVHGDSLVVADTYNHRVQVFTLSESGRREFAPAYLREISDPGGIAPLYPSGATADHLGNLYLTDSGGDTIQRRDITGTITVLSADGWNHPRAIDLDVDGAHLWVADTADDEIVMIGLDGSITRTIGGPTVLTAPWDVTNDSDGVYVADTYGNQVVKLRKIDGEVAWASSMCGGTRFKRPRALAVAGDDNVYVADTDNRRIVALDRTTGACAATYGPNLGGATLKAPRSVTGDGAGGLWVVDNGTFRLLHLDADGQLVSFADLGFGDQSGQFRSAGCLFLHLDLLHVCDTWNFRVQRFTSADPPAYDSELGFAPPAPGGFNGAYSVAYSETGELYAADFFNQRVQKFAPDGTFAVQFGGLGSLPGSLSFPRGVVVAPGAGEVIVTSENNGWLSVFDAAGTFLRADRPQGTRFYRPRQTAIAPDGTRWVADTLNKRVLRLDAAGAVLATVTKGGQMRKPEGVAVAADSTVIVSDSGRQTVERYSPTGAFLATLATTGTGPTNVKRPTGLSVSGPPGEEWVFVADTGNHRIVVLKLDGSPVGVFGSAGAGPGQFDTPRLAAVNPVNGDIAVADFNNNRISIWSQP